MITLDQLIACLTEVETIADDPTRWGAGTLGLPGGHVFGGQMIGQTAAIAARAHPEMDVKSVDVVFPKGARDTGELEYRLTPLHAGSAYATLQVDCSQPGRDGEPTVGFAAQVLCHRPAPGVEHHQDAPVDAGRPEDARPVDLGLIPWETRIVGDTDLDDRRAQPSELALWMRVADRDLGDDPSVHQALLAFASELTLIGTALLPHGEWSQRDAHIALRTSVIGHHVLFHRPFRLDDWLLLAQTSPVASGGSAYGTGHVYDIDGTLVASFSQQSMIRVAEPAS
ncbi:MAG: acyl-CoA thioesterase domain-containing protein [Ilumatobacteraceae bacterium]